MPFLFNFNFLLWSLVFLLEYTPFVNTIEWQQRRYKLKVKNGTLFKSVQKMRQKTGKSISKKLFPCNFVLVLCACFSGFFSPFLSISLALSALFSLTFHMTYSILCLENIQHEASFIRISCSCRLKKKWNTSVHTTRQACVHICSTRSDSAYSFFHTLPHFAQAFIDSVFFLLLRNFNCERT